MGRITSELLNMSAHVTNDDDLGQILKIVYDTLINAETRSRLHLYLVREALTGNEVLRKRFLRKYQQWQSMLEDGIKRIKPDTADIGLKAQLIIATIDGYIIQSMLGMTDLPISKTAEFIVKGK